jgi:hypothetical protein
VVTQLRRLLQEILLRLHLRTRAPATQPVWNICCALFMALRLWLVLPLPGGVALSSSSIW